MLFDAYVVVRLETELSLEGGLDLTLVATRAGEGSSGELSLDEELTVHDGGSRVEGGAGDGRVNVVLGSDGVGNQEPGRLELVEVTSVGKASQDAVDRVWDKYLVCRSTKCISQNIYRRAQGQDHQERLGWLNLAVSNKDETRPASRHLPSLRPMKALRVGIPGQLEAPTAPANWMLLHNTCISFSSLDAQATTYKSATVILLRSWKGLRVATTSSRPTLAWNAVSISGKIMMEPSAPPPLHDEL